MGIDVDSVLRPLGILTATIGALSLYANTVSYYGTKYKLNRLAKQYGWDYAEEVLKRECHTYRSPITNPFGGIGIKLLKEKYDF